MSLHRQFSAAQTRSALQNPEGCGGPSPQSVSVAEQTFGSGQLALQSDTHRV